MAENFKVKVTDVIVWTVASFSGYGYDEKKLYKMVDETGKIYTWKTTNNFLKKVVSDTEWLFADRGDEVEIRATVKGETEYKGEAQTELTRVKLVNIIKKAPTKEQLEEAKAKEQLASLKGEDFVWEMPYRQYKDHYADCETVAGSFRRSEYEAPTIQVIIREGRLVNSGVRGRKFASYELINEEGKKTCYYAVCEENALKRAEKDYPNHKWDLNKIYW